MRPDPTVDPHPAAVFAVDPTGIGGVLLRSRTGPARDAWLAALTRLLPAAPRRLPLHADDQRLLGGIDLAATLHGGRRVVQQGLLAESDGGVLVLPMAERAPASFAAKLAAVLDAGVVRVERDGVALLAPARLGIVALDEGNADDERTPAALRDRLGIHVGAEAGDAGAATADDVSHARRLLPALTANDDAIEALCACAAALGVDSLRAPLQALRVARAAAALAGRTVLADADVALAARWVLAPRARHAPAGPADEQLPHDAGSPPPPSGDTAAPSGHAAPPSPPPGDQAPAPPGDDATAQPPQPDAGDDSASRTSAAERELTERVLEAALGALPPDVLLRLQAAAGPRRSAAGTGGGRSGAVRRSHLRGRPLGSERGDPRRARLDVLATLRAAAPWQALRRSGAAFGNGGVLQSPLQLLLRRDDFRVRRHADRRETTTIFAVDGSGSAALHRLAEAKGAVELLLADCYVRRDRVALIGFRRQGAELLLAPTRSLPRAKRSLAALAGGGGTPLAAGIAAAQQLAEQVLRNGGSATVVLLTDGRANVGRDGSSAGRAAAHADALAAARALAGAGVATLWIDTSPQSQASGRELALAMGARYLALPHADAAQVAAAIGAGGARR